MAKWRKLKYIVNKYNTTKALKESTINEEITKFTDCT